MTVQRFAATTVIVIVVLAGIGSQPVAQTSRDPQFINLVEPWPYPFSSAVRAGDMLYLSGQIGSEVVDGQPRLVSGGIDAESRQSGLVDGSRREVLGHDGRHGRMAAHEHDLRNIFSGKETRAVRVGRDRARAERASRNRVHGDGEITGNDG
jgi:hypothetical protein